MPQITLDEIEKTVRRALSVHGAGVFAAAEVARAVRKAESVGNKICGLYYVESYCQQLRSGRVSGTVTPKSAHRALPLWWWMRALALPNPRLPMVCPWRWTQRAVPAWLPCLWLTLIPAPRWDISPSRLPPLG